MKTYKDRRHSRTKVLLEYIVKYRTQIHQYENDLRRQLREEHENNSSVHCGNSNVDNSNTTEHSDSVNRKGC